MEEVLNNCYSEPLPFLYIWGETFVYGLCTVNRWYLHVSDSGGDGYLQCFIFSGVFAEKEF